MNYTPRKVQKRIRDALDGPDILAVLGSRQVGKTTLMELIRRDIEDRWGDRRAVVRFDLDEAEHLTALNRDPRYFREFCVFSGADPSKDLVVLIDEIQNLQRPSHFLKSVGRLSPPIKLVVTGSTSFHYRKFTQPPAGRMKVFRLFPLDFEEFLLFKGQDALHEFKQQVNFRYFTDGTGPAAAARVGDFQEPMRMLFEEFVLYGGYPAVVLATSKKEKMAKLKALLESFELKGVNVLFDVANPAVFRSFFKLLAGDSGDLLNINAVSRTLRIGRDTVRRYLSVLEDSFMAGTLAPYHTRHRKELTKMPRFYFCDTGLRNYAISNFTELRFRPDKDRLFKNTIFCELIKNLRRNDRLFFWRTIARNDIDFVITGGRQAAFEVTTMPYFHPKASASGRAFGRYYPAFKRYVVNLDHFDSGDENIFLPGWML